MKCLGVVSVSETKVFILDRTVTSSRIESTTSVGALAPEMPLDLDERKLYVFDSQMISSV